MKLSSIISSKLINQNNMVIISGTGKFLSSLLCLSVTRATSCKFNTTACVTVDNTVTLVLCVYAVDTIYQRQIYI